MYFEDIPPEPKSKEELYILLLEEVQGKKVNLNKFFAREILDAQRYLVKNHYLEGCIDWNEIVYSKITEQGKEFLERLTNAR